MTWQRLKRTWPLVVARGRVIAVYSIDPARVHGIALLDDGTNLVVFTNGELMHVHGEHDRLVERVEKL